MLKTLLTAGALACLLGLVGNALVEASPRSSVFRVKPASAVLLPDYQWHAVVDGGVRLRDREACFDEFLGPGHMVETCCAQESLLGWRK